MNTTARFLLISLYVLSLSSVIGAAQTGPTTLEVGRPVVRILKVGETHTYKINAAAGQYLHVEVHQIFFDVAIALYSPDGKKLIEIDNRSSHWQLEEIHTITETTGELRFEIRRNNNAVAEPAHYEVEITELRPKTPSDTLTLKAVEAMNEGFLAWKKLESSQEKQASEQASTAAIEKYQEAIQLFQAATNVSGEIDALQIIGNSYAITLGRGNSKNILTGIEYLEKSLTLAEELGDKKQIATALHYLAYAYEVAAGDHMKARELYDKAFPIYEALTKKYLMWKILSGKGRIYLRLGDYDSALEQEQKAVWISDSIPEFPPQSLNSLGALHYYKGNLWKALECFLKALPYFERYSSNVHFAAVYGNIGTIYGSLGNLDLALVYFQKVYEKSAELTKNSPDKSMGGTALENIAQILAEKGRYDEALKKFQEALEIFERMKSQNRLKAETEIASIFHNIAHYELVDRERCLEYFIRSLEISKRLPDKRSYVRTLVSLADWYFLSGDYAESQKNLEEAHAVAQQNGYFEENWYRNLLFGKLYVRSEQPIKARQAFAEAITHVETLRAQGKPFEGMTQPYFEMVGLLTAGDKTDEAFSYAEQIKSRSLLDVLQNGSLDITKAMSAKERERETRLKKEMVLLNSQVSNEKDKTRVDELKKQLEAKRREFEDFENRLYALKPELQVQRGEMKPVSLEEVGNLLSDDKSALVEYVVGDDRSFLFVITKDSSQKVSLNVYPIEIKRKDLARQTEALRSKIAKADLDFSKAARDLCNLLLKPAEAQLKNKTSLVIVPDNVLWGLPFQVLQDAGGRFLIEQTAISYAPSLTAVSEMVKRNRGKQFSGATLLAFGNPTVNKETQARLKQVFMSDSLEPLPEAERLVNSLSRMYGAKNSKVFTGADAREETAKSESSKYRIVQFAAHGVLNDFAPMYSHIVLAQRQGNPNEDGLLEAWEMKDLDLNADMVILSACDTARGQVSSGEGVIGMTWAAFIAGAPTTVASQWKVESSSTTEFMLEFHRQMLAKKKISKAEALRRASLKLMRSSKYRHPLYWAPWVMIGDGS